MSSYDRFKQGVRVNLGDDTDTVAAIAGALYGLESIPMEWLATLQKREYIESLCEKAAKA